MKLRRSLAAAAVTAVIAPAAFLAAPSAFATDGAPTATPSETAAETTEPAATPGTTEPGPAETPSASESETSQPGGAEPTPVQSSPSESADDKTAEDTEEGTDEDAEEGSEPGPGERPWECPVDENDEEIIGVSDALTTSLTNLPDTVVAGSGWTDFQLQMANSGKTDIKGVAPFVAVFALGDEDAIFDGFTLEVKDASGAWTVVTDIVGAGGYFTQVDLKAGEKRTFEMRLKVDGKVPESLGVTIGAGEYSTEDGGCWISSDANEYVYFFDILEEGSELPEKPDDAKPQTGGTTPIKADKVTEVQGVTGNLAETGSSSQLPVIGLIGGITVVAGAGVVFAVKRRRSVEA
ncbi:LAETG motif-containing sortase-dependent surface protein [Streptomyces indicus]|uniref:LPXTG-motif cell wall anchor domain-containing protein n=1 Tax=Streptomyces indicus TaxID=417292 RepID=A0A1G9EDB8_9ACTN|nr:LAETG motif-containing sortase-dependent surface protein [Streptomyces indicus]SDK74137.1 LPXTG-motif cell wall anchor domain-containing protein [Streptomyces indicus]